MFEKKFSEALTNHSLSGELIPIQALEKNHPYRIIFWRFYCHPENNPFMFWPTQSYEEFCRIFENRLVPGSAEIFVYVENGEPVGACRLIQGKGPYQHVMDVASTSIDPEKKRQGIGTRVKQAAHKYIKDHYPHIKRIELSYESDNLASRKINGQDNYYEKCGYKTEARCDDWWVRSAPNYKNMQENNSYQTWLDKNKGDHRELVHFWPIREIFAAKLDPDLSNRLAVKGCDLNTLAVFPYSELHHAEEYNFRLANESDIEEIASLYSDSDTQWNKFYINEINLKAQLKEEIQQQQLFVVTSSEMVVSTAKAAKSSLVQIHSINIENVVIAQQHSNATATLFSKFPKYFLKNDPSIKRLEINIIDKTEFIIKALQATGFEYCGAGSAKYFDQKTKTYLDELMFDCNLFRLQDAKECCQKRLNAQKTLISLRLKIPFNVALEDQFLDNVIQLLGKIEEKYNKDQISFEQENIIYRIVRTICTQGYLSPQERLDYLLELKKKFNSLIIKEDLINELLEESIKKMKSFSVNDLNHPENISFSK